LFKLIAGRFIRFNVRSMILYHIKSAFKFILKFKSHTAFSLTGLIIGLACVFIISAWAFQELLFDRFHHQSDHIFMVTTDIRDNTGSVNRFPETPAPLADALEKQIPQIENGFHFLYLYGSRTIGSDTITFKEEGIAATPEFLEVFNFPLISGMASELNDPHSIFLSRRLADKLFPGTDPMGQELRYKEDQVLVVKGIFKNVPRNSSLQFDFLIPYEIEYGISEEWWQLSDATFIKVAESADIDEVHQLMKQIWSDKITDDQFDIGIIPITDLRYGADFEFFNVEHGHGSRNKLFMFLGVALLILILACLNYMNLISAYAIKREKELWIRKVHGASAGNISSYFIVESVLLSVFAWGLATLLSLLGIRIFETKIGVIISPQYFRITAAFGLLIAITVVGLATGVYPAIRAGSGILARQNGFVKQDVRFQRNLRNAFVLTQFILSIGLSISSITILRQAHFMRAFDTGYARQDIVEFNLSSTRNQDLEEIKNFLDANPNVEVYSIAGASPVSLTVLNTTEKWRWEGLEEGTHTSFFLISVDEDYLNVFQIPLIKGRFFSSAGTDQNRVVINEKLAGLLGFDDPVGRILRNGDEEYEIIGVVKDFNFQHLSKEIRPLLFRYSGSGRRLFVKLLPDAEGTLGDIQKQISGLSGKPVNYKFIVEEHNNLYKGEQQILSAILFFTILSIILSSLGLIGLVTYGTETMTREIAIRKVFGAETFGMMVTLNLNIFKLFLAGLFFGSIISWLIMRKWLEDFTYRVGLELWVFLSGALIILLFTILSIGIQTWKAAKQSPALALKYQ